MEAREYYAVSLFYQDRAEEAMALMDSDAAKARFAASDFLISTVNQFGYHAFAAELFEYRANAEPTRRQSWATNPQTWATLAYLYYQASNTEAALETLKLSEEKVPAFAGTAQCFATNIENGRDPQEGCQ